MSVRHRSKCCDFSSLRCAVPTSGAVRVSRFMRLSVRLTSSSRSGSSSTISTVGLLMRGRSNSIRAHRNSQRVGSANTSRNTLPPPAARLIEQRRAVGLRQLAREEQAQARAAAAAAEERLEDALDVSRGARRGPRSPTSRKGRALGLRRPQRISMLPFRPSHARAAGRYRRGSRRPGAAAWGPRAPRCRSSGRSMRRRSRSQLHRFAELLAEFLEPACERAGARAVWSRRAWRAAARC